MPPTITSRYRFSQATTDDRDRLFLEDREPYRYREYDDNRVHVVRGGETLWGVAHVEFHESFERPAGLWWIIGDFQPTPIHDPTLPLTAGSVLIIPSTETIRKEIFNERRRS